MQEDDIVEVDKDFNGLHMEERKVGDYECTKFILTEDKECRIVKPWK